jgi:hypothetical protein
MIYITNWLPLTFLLFLLSLASLPLILEFTNARSYLIHNFDGKLGFNLRLFALHFCHLCVISICVMLDLQDWVKKR